MGATERNVFIMKLIKQRHIDELGRIVIPSAIRTRLKLNEGDGLVVNKITDEKIYLKKATLALCGQLEINTQLILKIDYLGRIYLSTDIRKESNIVEQDLLNIYVDEEYETIIISK